MEHDACESVLPVYCEFKEDERVILHNIAQKEQYIAFPKWTLGILIMVLVGLWASSGALWFELQKKADKVDVELSRDILRSEIILLKDRLTKLETNIPDSFPPKWFLDQVKSDKDAINQTIKEMSTKLDTNRELLIELKTALRAHEEKGKVP